jgi:hypothetical protein
MAKTPMRCPVPDEDMACGAGRPILPEVGSDCLSDIVGKREAIVVASLAAHRKHTDSPINIAEFQGDDFACPQSQASQEQKDRVITTPD